MRDPLAREFLLAFWKIHILHHAGEQGVYGQWMLEELAEHGHRVSPGTLYPLLSRMTRHGWLKAARPSRPTAPRIYTLTPAGRLVLDDCWMPWTSCTPRSARAAPRPVGSAARDPNHPPRPWRQFAVDIEPPCLWMYRYWRDLVSYTGPQIWPAERRRISSSETRNETTRLRGVRRRDARPAPRGCRGASAVRPPRADREGSRLRTSRREAARSHQRPRSAFPSRARWSRRTAPAAIANAPRPAASRWPAWDAAKAADDIVTTEKMIRKLRAGMMPPATARRPDADKIAALASALETRVDRAAALNPNPGSRPFQRLNRPDYARAVKDILGVDVDVAAFLPPDTISHGFDNVADVQAFSPALMDGYLRAASKVTALAIGDPDAPATETNYRVPKTASQLTHVEGAPFGTRGGLSVQHTFPADGDYVFKVELHSNACGVLFGGPSIGEQVEVSVNGERAALMDINPRMAETTTGLSLKTPPIHIKAGVQRVTAAFIQRFEGPVNDLVAPIDHTLADTQIGVAAGITTLPHVKDFSIVGPYHVTGVSDTPSRRKIFTCRPTSAADEPVCAGEDHPVHCVAGVPRSRERRRTSRA